MLFRSTSKKSRLYIFLFPCPSNIQKPKVKSKLMGIKLEGAEMGKVVSLSPTSPIPIPTTRSFHSNTSLLTPEITFLNSSRTPSKCSLSITFSSNFLKSRSRASILDIYECNAFVDICKSVIAPLSNIDCCDNVVIR